MFKGRGKDEMGKFPFVAGILQVYLLVLFGLCVGYGEYPGSYKTANDTSEAEAASFLAAKYAKFQDVHVMIFIGFGFLMTFMKHYAFSAVGFTLFIAAFVIQWVSLTNGFWHNLYEVLEHEGEWERIPLDINSMIDADFGAGAILISFGAVLGKVSPLQLLAMAFFECIIYSGNAILGLYKLEIYDVGGSMVIHTFGAYFGLGVSLMVTGAKSRNNKNNGSMYYNDVFAMIGTIFLWLFWPSFNGAFAEGSAENRVMLQTYLALSAGCVMAFISSTVFRKGHKFDMVDIQNATLAAGVGIGSTADMILQPWGALLIGCCAGSLSVFGYAFIQPFLEEKVKLHDTCGVNNLHGLPGVMGGLASVVVAALASQETYGNSLSIMYPAGRSSAAQAGVQLAYLGITLAFSFFGGIFTGALIRLPFFEEPNDNFNDEDFWHVPLGNEEDDPEADPKALAMAKQSKPKNNARSNNFNTVTRRKGAGPAENGNGRVPVAHNFGSQSVPMTSAPTWNNPAAASHSLGVPSITVQVDNDMDDIQRVNYMHDVENFHN